MLMCRQLQLQPYYSQETGVFPTGPPGISKLSEIRRNFQDSGRPAFLPGPRAAGRPAEVSGAYLILVGAGISAILGISQIPKNAGDVLNLYNLRNFEDFRNSPEFPGFRPAGRPFCRGPGPPAGRPGFQGLLDFNRARDF